MIKKTEKIASLLLITANIFLFFIKLIASILTNSLAAISATIDSFLDIFSSSVVYTSIRVSHKTADKNHPFGHSRAQPMAAFVIAILTAVVGLQILKEVLGRLIDPAIITKSLVAIIIFSVVVVIKLNMFLYLRKAAKKTNSEAIRAGAIDCRNDLFSNSFALSGIICSYFGYNYIDSIMGIFICVYILRSGYKIAMDNLKYLMGEAPNEETIKDLEKIALACRGVKGINSLKAHYIGTKIQMEIAINVDEKINMRKAHDIGENVKKTIKNLPQIEEVFVHIDCE